MFLQKHDPRLFRASFSSSYHFLEWTVHTVKTAVCPSLSYGGKSSHSYSCVALQPKSRGFSGIFRNSILILTTSAIFLCFNAYDSNSAGTYIKLLISKKFSRICYSDITSWSNKISRILSNVYIFTLNCSNSLMWAVLSW